jgi:putative chitobiose transport system permease protein
MLGATYDRRGGIRLATVTATPPAAVATPRLRIRRRNHLRKDELSVFGVLLLVAFAILMFVPFVVLFGRAFMTYDELFHFPPIIIPYQVTTQNFSMLVLALGTLQVPFARYLFNSVLVSVAVVLGVVVIATLAAYPLSKHRKMPGHGFIWFMVIASIMYAGPATNVPRYLIIDRLHLVDTYWALILPVVVSTFGLFLMKQYID